MKRLVPLCLFFAFFAKNNLLFSQAKINVDSLVAFNDKYLKEDTVKVKMLIDLIYEYRRKDTKKAMEYTESAIKISEQIGNVFFIAESYCQKGTISLQRGNLSEAKNSFQKAIANLENNNKYLSRKGEYIMLLGSVAIANRDFTTALQLNESALAIFESTKKKTLQIKAMINLGVISSELGNYEKALDFYQKGLKENEAINNEYNTQLLYSNIGLIYYTKGNYKLFLDYTFKAIAVSERLGELHKLTNDYGNIAAVYLELNDKKEAQKYATKALDIYRKMNNKTGIAEAMINVAFTYDDHQKAIEDLKKTIEYCKEINNNHLLAYAYQGLSNHFFKLLDYKSAYFYAQQGLELEKEVKDEENIIKLNNQIANILIVCSNEDLRSFDIEPNDRYEKAKKYVDIVFSLANKGNLKQTSDAWNFLSIIQEKQQNYVQAYESYKKYITIKDSISGDEVKKQITRKEIQYEYDKKETELLYQQQLTMGQLEKQRLLTFQQGQTLTLNSQTLTLKEQALALSNKEKDLVHLAFLKEQAEKQEKTQELSLSEEREKGAALDLSLKNLELSAQQKQNLYLGLFSLLLLGGFAALLYFYNTLKKQKNIISQQNELNEHTIAILSHDIKEPLLGVKLMLKKLNKDDPFVAQASQSLENQVNVVNGILSNLLKVKKLALSKKDNNAKANVKSVVQNVIQELSIAIQSKDLTIQNELPDELMLPIAPEKLQIIVNNLLSNAVKYSFPNQNIRIFQEGNGFSIQDFGIGLSPEQRSKIMREVTVSKQGTNTERGNGLGLFLVGAMLQGEQIKVLFSSPEVGGTIVKVLG